MSDLYIAAFVGCIECGVPSLCLGVFAAASFEAGGDSWGRYGGEGHCAVYGPLVVNAYAEAEACSDA